MKIRAIKLLSISLLFVSFFLTGCKDTFQASRPSYWPLIKINGDALMVQMVGDPFVDPSAVVTIGGTPVPFDTDNPVDPDAPGVYVITYSAANSDGVTASAQRTVVILPGAVTNDVDYIEGDYETSPMAGNPAVDDCKIEKIAPGVYHMGNLWGSGSLALIPGYFFCLDGVTLTVPNQNGGAANIESVSPGVYDDVNFTITWTLVRPLFPGGPLVRTKFWAKV